MSTEHFLRGLVLKALAEEGISQAEAARRLGLSNKHLNQMLTGRARLTLNWAEKILQLCDRKLVIGVAKMNLDGS